MEKKFQKLQMVFMQWQMEVENEKGTIDTIFLVSQMMEKYEVAKRQLLMVFVDFKSFD